MRDSSYIDVLFRPLMMSGLFLFFTDYPIEVL